MDELMERSEDAQRWRRRNSNAQRAQRGMAGLHELSLGSRTRDWVGYLAMPRTPNGFGIQNDCSREWDCFIL